MKRFIILFTIAIATVTTVNSQTMNVALNKLYCDTSDFVLPDKAIKQKMPMLTIANPKWDFTVKFRDIANRIATEDYDNIVFTVMLHYAGVGIDIDIDSQDILDLNNVKYYGDFIVDRRHFVLLENEDNKDLLKTFFKKARGKDVVFERTFEKVIDMIAIEPTHYKAIYNERQRSYNVNEFIANGTDKLNKAPAQIQDAPQEQNVDDNDAFKIDVELFDQ